MQVTGCNFQYGPNLGVPLDPSFWLWRWFFSWKSVFTTGHCIQTHCFFQHTTHKLTWISQCKCIGCNVKCETTVLHCAQLKKYACLLRASMCAVFTSRRVHDIRLCLYAKCPTKKLADWHRNLQSDVAIREICTHSSHSWHPCQSCRSCHWCRSCHFGGPTHCYEFHHVVDDDDDDGACVPRIWLHCRHSSRSCERNRSLMGLCRDLWSGRI